LNSTQIMIFSYMHARSQAKVQVRKKSQSINKIVLA